MVNEIALGIGDLFITRLLFDANNFRDELFVNLKIVKNFRSNNEEYKNFVLELIAKLFPDCKIEIGDENNSVITKGIKYYYQYLPFNLQVKNLKKWFNLDPIFELTNKNYIVFHTKIRMDGDHKKEFLNPLRSYLQKLDNKIPIVLLGEKEVSQNAETNAHKIISIYDDLIKLNNVIDLTEKELYNTPNIKNFERDLRIIANAKCNFGLGWGGNFGMSWAVSNNFCFFVGELQHPILQFFDRINPNHLPRKIEKFIEYLDESVST